MPCLKVPVAVAGVAELACLSQLQRLRIEKSICDCNNWHAIQRLSPLSSLTQLKLVNVSIHAQSLCAILRQLSNLVSLKVSFTCGGARRVIGLQECLAAQTQLEDVDLEGVKFPWSVLCNLPSARTLCMTIPDDVSANINKKLQVNSVPAVTRNANVHCAMTAAQH
jgi:hypothetical protein